jgi:hypothetical protein
MGNFVIARLLRWVAGRLDGYKTLIGEATLITRVNSSSAEKPPAIVKQTGTTYANIAKSATRMQRRIISVRLSAQQRKRYDRPQGRKGGQVNLTENHCRKTYQRACPSCGSWNLKPQTPIDVDIDITDAHKALGQYFRAIKAGATPLKGPCYIMCFDCLYKGPSVDCRGRTSEDVGRDKAVFAEMKRLWLEHEYIPGHKAAKETP